MKPKSNILLGSLLSLGLAFILYGATGRDDNYISFWPAWAWVEEGLPFNYNGQALEQSSALLWVALLALSNAITKINIPDLAYAWGIIGLLGTIWGSQRLAKQLGISQRMLRWLPLLIGTQAYLAYWSLSGMETSLATALMVWTFSGWLDGLSGKWPKWLPFALLAWLLLRPEAGFVALLTCGMAIFILRKENTAIHSKAKIWLPIATVAALLALLIVTRLSITGQAFPNPAILKSSLPWWFKLKSGAKYLIFQGLLSDLGILAFAFAATFLLKKQKLGSNLSLLLSQILSIGAFVLVSGGDWMEAGRFLVPLGPLLILLSIALLEKSFPLARLAWLAPAMLLLNLGFNLKIAAFDSTGSPLWAKRPPHSQKLQNYFSSLELRNRGHLADAHGALALNQVLNKIEQQWHGPYRVMSGQAGMMMYYNAQWHRKQVEWVDFYGLSTQHVADCPIAWQMLSSMQPFRWEYGGFFEMMEKAGEACKPFQRPEVVFDLDFQKDPQHLAFERNGYQVVWKQSGTLRNTPILKGAEVNAYLFIAVSQEFMERLPHGIHLDDQVL